MSSTSIQVLLIDPYGADVRLMTEMLHASGMTLTVIHADTVGGGLARMATDQVDLVLLAVTVRDANGLDALKRLTAAAPGTPVVVLADGYDANLALCAVKAGAQDFLIKTLMSADGLARVVCYAIERGRTEAVDRERRSLDRALRAMERVLGEVGHELRTPLAAIRATADVLATVDTSTEKRQEFLRRIQAQVVAMTHLVDEMIESARLNSGLVRWRWTSFELEPLCNLALDQIRPLVDDAVALHCHVAPTSLHMLGDERAVWRLLVNLLSNAARHTARGEIHVTAEPIRIGDEDGVRLAVRDTGVGIPSDLAERLGDPFTLYGEAGHELMVGTGLGLSICKRIAATHGGNLHIKSQVGHGTCVAALLRSTQVKPCTHSGPIIIDREIAA